MERTIIEELENELLLMECATCDNQLMFETGYALGILRASFIKKLISVSDFNKYTDKVYKAQREKLEEFF